MKKIFQIIGLITLTCFSFFITEKTATVVNDMDDIMIEIKENKDKYKQSSIDAIIDNNTIIPGVRGREVNISKSYRNMKNNGFYSDSLYIYNYTYPKVSLTDNMDKYIIKGNPSKRMVSLIFTVEANDNVIDILNIINNYNVKATFFVNTNWNNDLVKELIKDGHNVGILLDDYNDSNFDWMDMVIKRVNKQQNGFCYNLEDNKSNVDICKVKGNYTIRPVVISDKTPLQDIKSKLEPGSLLSLKINSQVKKELSSIIIYIKSKGYKLSNLEENVLE